MKKITFLLCLALTAELAYSQPWEQNIGEQYNFFSIQKAYQDWKAEEVKSGKASTQAEEADGIETKFRRWEYIMEPRTYPSGNYPPCDLLLKEARNFSLKSLRAEDTVYQGDWYDLEKPEGFQNNGVSGRLNCIAFHPLDTNIIFVGSPSGGLWKTTDGGKSWATNTDNFPSLGVSEIVFNPLDPNVMYMATGDRDAAYFISNPYSYSLLKGTDGGKSWDTTGLNFLVSSQMTIQRVLIHPTKPDILMAAVTGETGSLRGIWRTEDAGKNWKLVTGGAKYDLEYNPANPDIVYSTGYKNILRSNDGGKTWASLSSPNLPPTANITSSKIAVTPANPHLVFAQFQNPSTGNTYGLYKSTDDGTSWVQLNTESISIQAGYDWVLTVSPGNPDIIHSGGQYLYCSTNGGVSSDQYPSGHVDHHDLVYRPGTEVLYNCNDGGLFKSYNYGLTWINLNKGLQTFQYYRMGSSETKDGFILAGAQDNGIQKHNRPSWAQTGLIADGMECIVDYTDPNIYYVSYQYGYLQRTGMGLPTFNMPPNGGYGSFYAWVTPYLIHPVNPKILYVGGKEIYKTTNRGTDWFAVTNGLTAKDGVGGGMLRAMVLAPSSPDSFIYAGSYVVLYMTSDGGKTWINATSNLPVTAGCFDCSAISSIAVHPNDPLTVFVAMSGYSKNNKVFKTTNGGIVWTNISDNLPAIPVNSIVIEKNSKDGLYIGTDLGIFYRDSTMKGWIPYMKGLPNVPVQELEIYYPTKKLRAATFGRGLWESNLYGVTTSVSENNIVNNQISYIVKDYLELPAKLADNNSELMIFSSLGKLVYQGRANRRIDLSALESGLYFARISGTTIKILKQSY